MRHTLFVFGISAVLGWADAVFVPPTPDRELSRRFEPPRFRVSSDEAKSRLREFFGQGRDSGESFSLKGRSLRLSSRGLRQLEAVDGSEDALGKGAPESIRHGIHRRLTQVAGNGIEEDPVYSAAVYLPDDIGLQPTAQWPLYNEGSLFASVKGLDIGMSKVWEKFDGDDSLVIAVLDAGFSFLHPDLKGRHFVNRAEAIGLPDFDDDGNGFKDDSTGWDFVDGDNHPHDSHSHGTNISGLIAAISDNGIGMAGMLPRVRILPVRVLSTTGNGASSDIAAGLRYAAKMGADVVNFSIGIGSTSLDTALRNAFYVTRDSGVIVVAAAANDGRDLDAQPRAPSSYNLSTVYMVAAHDMGGALPPFSNYGANTVDLAAPGDYITTATTPAPVEALRETFEGTVSSRWTFSSGFAVAADTLEGTKSLRWSSGNTSRAELDSLDLRGRIGGQISFITEFQRAAGRDDWVIAEVLPAGASTWITIATMTANVTGKKTLAFNLGEVDGRLFKLRIRADFISSGSRTLRIDDIRVKYSDMSPGNQDKYITTGGTSVAAPFVAGYAGLMRVACKRMGVPFTRARMLAGTVPDPHLTGKVITDGRLDVAKGLDFYLRTLPSLKIADSSATAWPLNASVQYALSVRDTGGQPLSGYAYAVNSQNGGGALAGNQYAWNAASPAGAYTVRVRAEKAPLVLRKQIHFTVGVATAVAAGAQASVLRVGNREFLLPPAAFLRDAHALRLEFYGADGRTRTLVTGDLRIPPGARRAEYRVEGFPGVGLRAWLDGVPLRPMN